MQTASKKVIHGWAMYDWANSVYNLVITSTIFPAYFESITGDRNEETTGDTVVFLGRTFVNTSLYDYALAIALLIVAFSMPILTSIADSRGSKKKFMGFFLTMGSIACAGMWFFTGKPTLVLGISLMMLACIGFWSSYVFSNSYLPEIAAPEDRDKVSAKGFSYGYVGSVILQVICFVFIFNPEFIGGSKTSGTVQYQFSFLLVGIWWLVFGFYSLSRLPKPLSASSANNNHQKNIFTDGYKELRVVWNQLKNMPVIKKYLMAFFFYNMGVQTIMLAATLYGKSELAIPTSNLITAILLIQLVAIPGAYLISKLSEKIGNIQALMCVVAIWVVLCIAGYMVPKGGINQFYALGACVGFVMGGIQSLSRSTYSKLMPEATVDTASFFSFYDVTEKIAIVLGLFTFGLVNELTGSQRNSVLALTVFFIIGFLFLFITNKQYKKEQAII
jgi:MFS transporter, UMF1 family